jgi:ribose transport system ATP-binding protein
MTGSQVGIDKRIATNYHDHCNYLSAARSTLVAGIQGDDVQARQQLIAGQRGTEALSLRALSKTFGAQRALDRVDLDVAAGQIHALVGQNGCGKSTLVKTLAGYHQPDPGATALIAGEPFELGSATAAEQAGLRFVHQDLGLIERLSVADNFRLARRVRGLARLDRKAERLEAQHALDTLGYDIDPTALVADLVESERTAVAVARALDHAVAVPLLVLDEPTASLPGPEVERLFDALRRVAAMGTAVLFISHHLDEVLGLADQVTVLRDGRLVTTTSAGGLSHGSLVELMLGRQLIAAESNHQRLSTETSEAPRLLVRSLTGATVRGMDFAVQAGQVLGIAGLTGSGREEVASLLAGRLPRGGTVVVDGSEVRPGEPRKAIDGGLCYVPADRAAHALLPKACVRENLTLGDLAPFRSRGRLRLRLERREAKRWVGELDVRPATPESAITELSGGNQQKVVIARWLRVQPPVLVLDEPTQGVDVGSKADIHRFVDKAAAAGSAVVVCSTDDDELARLATEVIVMRRGKAALRLTGDEISAERIEREQLIPAEPLAASVGAPDFRRVLQ